jgi:phosphoheptose isomerase
MKVKLSLVIQNHLSDAAVVMIHNPGTASDHITFVKNLIAKYSDTSVEVEESELDEMWEKVNLINK